MFKPQIFSTHYKIYERMKIPAGARGNNRIKKIVMFSVS